ncbi:translation elongation factor Ts [Candidatus Aerophobetes bacterium]|nr:translation elongation factor Ts [Candidatus Aerophobetes bacterium]
MSVSMEKIKRLREETSAKLIDCKKALEEAGGNIDEARKILRKKGAKIAQKKSGEKTGQGTIASYVHHNGNVGVLVEVHCQSDFVARTDEFQTFAKDIAMHIAAFNPQWISPEEVPSPVIEEEKDILRAQARQEGKPDKIIERIVEGRIKKFYSEKCLLSQPFLKDEKKTVKEHLEELIAKVGENVRIHRFTRYELRQE